MEEKYTVFFKDQRNGSVDAYEDFVYAPTLEAVIAWTVRQGEFPLAWAPFRLSFFSDIDVHLQQSIAAGRVIDFVDGKYIPRGTPEANAEEQRSLYRLGRLNNLEVADRNCAMRPSDEIPPAPLPVEKVRGFDAFKGWAPVISGSISQPQPMGLPSSDLQRVSHQVHYEHGSAVFALEKKG